MYRGKQSLVCSTERARCYWYCSTGCARWYWYCSPSLRGVLGNMSHKAESHNEHQYRSVVVRLKVSNFRIFTANPFTLKIKDYSIWWKIILPGSEIAFSGTNQKQ